MGTEGFICILLFFCCFEPYQNYPQFTSQVPNQNQPTNKHKKQKKVHRQTPKKNIFIMNQKFMKRGKKIERTQK